MTCALRAICMKARRRSGGRSERRPGSNSSRLRKIGGALRFVGYAVRFRLAQDLRDVGLLHEADLRHDPHDALAYRGHGQALGRGDARLLRGSPPSTAPPARA